MERIEAGASSDEHHGGLVAPMPGVVLEVLVSAGESVEAGQTLMILEAMKMEHRIVGFRRWNRHIDSLQFRRSC